MSKKKFWFIVIIFSLLTLLTGCGRSETTPTPNVEATVNARLTEVAQTADGASTETATAPAAIARESGAAATPQETATATPTATAAPPCRVSANALNVRAGPALVFGAVNVLPAQTSFTPSAISPDGSFMFIQTSSGISGWVSTDPQLVECTISLATLPVDEGPPTPTASPTAPQPPTATATPTRAALVTIPRAGGGDGDLTGDVFTLPELFTGPVDNPIFADRMFLQVIVYDAKDPDAPRDGAGIERVEIEIRDADESGNAGDTAYYESTEESAAFCSFGGNGPCNVLMLGGGAKWPGTNEPIQSGVYSIGFTVVPEREDSEGGFWRIVFRIQLPGDPLPGAGVPDEQPLEAQIVDAGNGDQLIFEVEARDPNVGTQNGAGIEKVTHRILNSEGDEIYSNDEATPAYCAFGGNGPCNRWIFSEHGYRWPNDQALEEGTYRLIADVLAADGRTIRVEDVVNLRTAYTPPQPNQLVAEIAELLRYDELVFEVVAYDEAVGTDNGDGIDRVEFEIHDSSGRRVYQKSENSAAYCAFGGDRPCPTWSPSENDNRWPGDQRFSPGTFRIRAVVHARSGQQVEIVQEVELE